MNTSNCICGDRRVLVQEAGCACKMRSVPQKWTVCFVSAEEEESLLFRVCSANQRQHRSWCTVDREQLSSLVRKHWSLQFTETAVFVGKVHSQESTQPP